MLHRQPAIDGPPEFNARHFTNNNSGMAGSQEQDVFGDLGRLPPEIRQQIYILSLSIEGSDNDNNQPDIDVFRPTNNELSLLATSRAIFKEAAPLYYRNRVLYVRLKPVPTNPTEIDTRGQQQSGEPQRDAPTASLAQALEHYVNTHFPPTKWSVAGTLRLYCIRNLTLDINCCYFTSFTTFLEWFSSPAMAGQLHRFPVLQTVNVTLRINKWLPWMGSKIKALKPNPDDNNEQSDAAVLGFLHDSPRIRTYCQLLRKLRTGLWPPRVQLQFIKPHEGISYRHRHGGVYMKRQPRPPREVLYWEKGAVREDWSEMYPIERLAVGFLNRVWGFVGRNEGVLEEVLGRGG